MDDFEDGIALLIRVLLIMFGGPTAFLLWHIYIY